MQATGGRPVGPKAVGDGHRPEATVWRASLWMATAIKHQDIDAQLRQKAKTTRTSRREQPKADTGVCSCIHDYHLFSSAGRGAGKRWYQVAVRSGEGGRTAQCCGRSRAKSAASTGGFWRGRWVIGWRRSPMLRAKSGAGCIKTLMRLASLTHCENRVDGVVADDPATVFAATRLLLPGSFHRPGTKQCAAYR